MKLLRVALSENLNESFRSLHPGFEINFNPNFKNDQIEPIGLAGLNGSGKSNLLELLSEIFYYLDGQDLDFPSGSVIEQKKFGFEIDYALPLSSNLPIIDFEKDKGFSLKDSYYVIRIIKLINKDPEFYLASEQSYSNHKKNKESGKIENILPISEWKKIEDPDDHFSLLLPSKIFAYSSGQNELLSNSYYKMQFHYFSDYEKQLGKGENIYLDSSRLFFSDYKSNESIFVSNYLLGDNKCLKVLGDVVGIKELHSFRITIRYKDYRSNEIEINDDLERRINRLRKCATTWIQEGEAANRELTLDYLVNGETKKAFAEYFGSPFELYKTFYELEMLNFNSIQKSLRKMAKNGPKWLNISDELPTPDPNKLQFRLERIKLKKKWVSDSIFYKALSDGEHQFLQIAGMLMMVEEDGCLFLLDEPDTHYNPLWRSRLVSTLNKIISIQSSEANKKSKLQELIITTHSPFIISDLKKKSVYIFSKPRTRVDFSPCHFETYGTSVSIIMDEIFEKQNSISEMAKNELEGYKESITNKEELELAIQEINARFGDSVDKIDLFSDLQRLKEKFESE